MCNEAARLRAIGEISAAFSQLKIPLRFPEGVPNLGEAPSIHITDPAAIVRAAVDAVAGDGTAEMGGPTPGPSRERAGSGAAELVVRRWSWPGAGGKPVYNFRSEGRTFPAVSFAPRADDAGAATKPADGDAGAARELAAGARSAGGRRVTGGRCLIPLDAFFEFTDPEPGSKRKTKWRFTAADGGLIGLAGLWRAGVVPGAGGDGDRASEAFTMLTCEPGPDVAPYHARQVVVLPRGDWAAWLAGDDGLIAPAPAGTLAVARADSRAEG